MDATTTRCHSTIYVFSTHSCFLAEDKTRSVFDSLARVRNRECHDFPVLFAINKVDIPVGKRNCSIGDIYSFIEKIVKEYDLRNTAIFETSAKEGININEIFNHVVLRMEYFEKFPFLDAIEDIVVNDTESLKNMATWKLKRSKNKKCIIC